MEHYFITGASAGIGRALVEALLSQRKEVYIHGCSRRDPSITDPRFHFYPVDFAKSDQVNEFAKEFFNTDVSPKVSKLVLVNNAGTIGNIGFTGHHAEKHYEQVLNVNTLVPMVLSEQFIRLYQDHPAQKIILNISSGAAQKDIAGWAAYCASKAALDRFSTVCALEQETRRHPVHVYSVSPGVIDTAMQESIRAADPTQFPLLEKFKTYHSSGELTSPSKVADQLLTLLSEAVLPAEVLLSLRNR